MILSKGISPLIKHWMFFTGLPSKFVCNQPCVACTVCE